jgi:hypothetical protein
MNFVVQELYESVLINEMKEKVVRYLQNHTDQLPFDHIFGDKMRVAFPIGTDVTAQSIIDDLKRIQHFDKIDLKLGEVVRKIKLDPKYGQGDYKEQKINMGKAISALKIPEDKKKNYLDWFARYKDNLEAAFEKAEFVVILSRAPIDVVRMSDHRNITSCHSQGGSYFQCAIQEAISGGAVAYVVREEDFNELTEEDFQKREIFVDSDRGISGAYGLRPMSRLRVRRLVDDDGDEFAIPDTKIYGDTTIPNFYKSLVNYLKNKQATTPEDFRGASYTKKGGTYYDDEIRDLVANYFTDEESTQYSSDFKRINHDRDDERGESRHSQLGLEDELEEIKERYNNRLEHSSVDYYLMDDEEVYFQASGTSTIDLTKFNLPDDVELEAEDYDVKKARDGEYDDDYEYSQLFQYIYDATDINIYRMILTNTSLEIHFSEEEYHNDSDKFDNYCHYMKSFDDKIENMLDDEDELLEIFIATGFIKNVEGEDKNFSMIEDYINMEEEPFNHLTISGGSIKKSFNVKLPSRLIIIEDIHNALRETMRGKENQVKGIITNIINNLAIENFKPKSDENDIAQLQFDKFFESYTNPLDGINYVLSLGTHFNYGDFEITNMTLNFPKMDNKNYQFVEFVDDMYSHIINAYRLSVLYMLNTIGIHKNEFYELSKQYNYPQLYKLYYKYL